MDFIAMSVLYGIFAFFKFIFSILGNYADTDNGQRSGDQSEGLLAGYFMFDENTRGVNQKDDDPYLNSEYDNGPDW